MDYYFNINGGSPFGRPYQPNRPLRTPEGEALKRGIFKNTAYLGILLLLYNWFNSIFVNVFYLGAYTVLHGGVVLSVNAAVSYLAEEQYELATSTAFTMTANTVVVVLSITALFIVARCIMKIDILSMFKPKKNLLKQGVVWMPTCLTLNLFASIIASVFVAAMSDSGVTVPEADFSISSPSTYSVVIQIVYVCIVGPIVEETIYRGLILKLLSPYGKGMAIFFSALIFGLMHGNIPQAVSAFAGGVVYAMVAVYFDSIVPTIIIHVLNNTFASITDIGDALDFAYTNELYYAILIVLFFAGMYGIIVKIKPVANKIRTSQPVYALSASKRVGCVCCNIFMIAYFLYTLWQYVQSFITINSG